MALTPPTVSFDPTNAAELNTALAQINGFAVTVVADTLIGLRATLEIVQLKSGKEDIKVRLDGAISAVAAAARPPPTVVANPATKDETDAASASMSAQMDLINAAGLAAAVELRSFLRLSEGSVFRLISQDAAQVELGTPVTLTAPTVASDPASKAHSDAMLASLTVFVDNANSELAAVFQNVVDAFGTSTSKGMSDLMTSIGLLQSP